MTPTRIVRRALVAGLATLSLGLAACGGDDAESGDDTTATADTSSADTPSAGTATADTATADTSTDGTATEGTATAGTGTADTAGGGEVGTREQYVEATAAEVDFEDAEITECFAEAIISDDVYAAIEEAGLSVDQFSESGPAGLGVTEEQATAVAADMASCGDLLPLVLTDEEQLACAQDNVSNEQMAELLSVTLFGITPSEELEALNASVEECVSGTTATTS